MSSKCWMEGACGSSFRVPTPGGHTSVHFDIQGHRLPHHGTHFPEGSGYPSLAQVGEVTGVLRAVSCARTPGSHEFGAQKLLVPGMGLSGPVLGRAGHTWA